MGRRRPWCIERVPVFERYAYHARYKYKNTAGLEGKPRAEAHMWDAAKIEYSRAVFRGRSYMGAEEKRRKVVPVCPVLGDMLAVAIESINGVSL